MGGTTPMGKRRYVTILFPITTPYLLKSIHPSLACGKGVSYLLRRHLVNVLLIPCAGYVSSGARFPLLVDPELYLLYAGMDVDKNRTREAQTAETLGDKLYAKCLYHLLSDWRLPSACIAMLVPVLASNNYQKRIAERYNLIDLFFNGPSATSRVPISDLFEVSSTHLPR